MIELLFATFRWISRLFLYLVSLRCLLTKLFTQRKKRTIYSNNFISIYFLSNFSVKYFICFLSSIGEEFSACVILYCNLKQVPYFCNPWIFTISCQISPNARSTGLHLLVDSKEGPTPRSDECVVVNWEIIPRKIYCSPEALVLKNFLTAHLDRERWKHFLGFSVPSFMDKLVYDLPLCLFCHFTLTFESVLSSAESPCCRYAAILTVVTLLEHYHFF